MNDISEKTFVGCVWLIIGCFVGFLVSMRLLFVPMQADNTRQKVITIGTNDTLIVRVQRNDK